MKDPGAEARRSEARNRRIKAADIAFSREIPEHVSNGDEENERYNRSNGRPSYIASFTKGLIHDSSTGLIKTAADFRRFLRGTEDASGRSFPSLPLYDVSSDGTYRSAIGKDAKVRAWESMNAGLAYDLEGPDAQAVTMPPVPTIESPEVHLEMAEVFWMALIRDIPLSWFSREGRQVINTENTAHPTRPGGSSITSLINSAIRQMNGMEWIQSDTPPTGAAAARKRDPFNRNTVFRGILPGDNTGPYLSQFLLIGTRGLDEANVAADGIIQYGPMRIDQRVRYATPGVDYMTNWAQFIDVQNGADLRGRETYELRRRDQFRFIATARDLATYVHYDALYQAYLNACLILLDKGVKYYDMGLPYTGEDSVDKQQGFALFGGPHILTLVTEVATRALKAVRYQKYNVHRRLRPEAMAGILDRHIQDEGNELINLVGQPLEEALGSDLIERVIAENDYQNQNVQDIDAAGNRVRRRNDLDSEEGSTRYALLPLAFAEGSPMHPAYGSGHATVGGACVTILKAFFDCDQELDEAYVVNEDGSELVKVNMGRKLKVGDELNKLVSNIAVGRNWAGVHWFSDYYESALLGEEVALGLLEEQMVTYGENFTMTVPLFDGKTIATITKDGIHKREIKD